MHLERGIICTYRWSDDLSTRSYGQNTLTRKYADTNNAPRDPLHDPVTISKIGVLRTNASHRTRCEYYIWWRFLRRYQE